MVSLIFNNDFNSSLNEIQLQNQSTYKHLEYIIDVGSGGFSIIYLRSHASKALTFNSGERQYHPRHRTALTLPFSPAANRVKTTALLFLIAYCRHIRFFWKFGPTMLFLHSMLNFGDLSKFKTNKYKSELCT